MFVFILYCAKTSSTARKMVMLEIPPPICISFAPALNILCLLYLLDESVNSPGSTASLKKRRTNICATSTACSKFTNTPTLLEGVGKDENIFVEAENIELSFLNVRPSKMPFRSFFRSVFFQRVDFRRTFLSIFSLICNPPTCV